MVGKYSNSNTKRTHGYLLNTYWRRTPESSFTTFFPLFFHSRDLVADTTMSGAIPLYFYRRDKTKTDIATPISWVRKYKEGGSRGFVLPVFWNTSKGSRSWGLFPLMARMENKEKQSTFEYYLLYFSKTSPDSKMKMLLPLYFSKESSTVSTNVLFPLYIHYHNKETNTGSRILFPSIGGSAESQATPQK